QLPARRLAALRRALATPQARQRRLRAAYVDTTDGRLSAAGLALRLRDEDGQWVQTLKGRGDGLAQRLEDEVPLGPAADGAAVPVPDPARHDGTAVGRLLARALEGAGALQVQFVTDIRRCLRVVRSGGARIEVALDEGEIRAGDARAAVCEVEFELLEGPRAALLALAGRWAQRFGLVLDVTSKAERGHALARGVARPPAVRAGPVSLPPGADLACGRAAMVAAALAQALPNAAALTNGQGEAEHVHQLRVALRRLRTVLGAFGPVDEPRDAAVAALFAALGEDRDAAVLGQTLAPALRAARRLGLAVAEGTAVPAPAPSLVERLQRPDTTALWLDLLRLCEPQAPDTDAAPASLADTARRQLARLRRRCRRDLARWADLDDAARHGLRKRLKRLRYLLDACASLLPRKALARELAALEPLQDALGQWNDRVVAHAALAAKPTPDAADRFAQGWLAAEAASIERRCLRAGRRWRRLARPG
ncbi:MAG: CYTH and CHAD domain-containing protein, partial [Aquabacterium sp.]